MHAVLAADVEPDLAITGLVEDHVHDPPELDAARDDPPVQQLDPFHPWAILPEGAQVET